MGLEATWSLVDIPSDARDAAQAAARREGVSVGEWLTRRILKRFSELNSREQEESFVALRNHVTELSDRIERFEGSRTEPMREALRKLHQGLTRLNEELLRTAGHSAIQVSELSSAVDALGEKVEELAAQGVQGRNAFERRMAQLQEFVDGVNLRHAAETREVSSTMESLSGAVAESCRRMENERGALERLERNVAQMDARHDGVRRELNEKFEVLSNGLERVGTAASDSSAAANGRVELLEQQIGKFETLRRDDAQSLGSTLDKFQDKLDDLRTATTGVCGAMGRRLSLTEQSLQSMDSRYAKVSQTLTHGVESVAAQLENVRSESAQASATLDRRIGEARQSVQEMESRQSSAAQTLLDTRNRQACTASAILKLEENVKQLGARVGEAGSDDRFAALEQNISALTNRTEAAESGLSALQPKTESMSAQLGNLNLRIDGEIQRQQQALEELKASLFEQTLNALGAKLETESRKQQTAIDELKSGLLSELAQAFDVRDEADERKQRDAIAQLQSGFALALHALGETFESQAKKQQDAIAELKASLTADPQQTAAAAHPEISQASQQVHEFELQMLATGAAHSDAWAGIEGHADVQADTETNISTAASAEHEEPVLELTALADPLPARTESVHLDSVEEHEQMPATAAPEPPPFASVETVEHPDFHIPAFGEAAQLASASVLARDAEESQPSAASYLSATRQSLQAAAARSDADTSGKEFFALRFLRSVPLPGKNKGQATSYALLAGIALLAILAVIVAAGELMNRRATPSAVRARTPQVTRATASSRVTAKHVAGNAATHSTLSSTIPAAANEDRISELAKGGDAHAQLLLGLGELGKANNTAAAEWLGRAAIQGEPVAQYRLGTLYASGRGVPADKAKAFRWYLAAAQAGNRKAMSNLAVAYAQGYGTAKNPQEAGRWFLKGAQLGLADAQFDLAILYERGLGVPQNLTDAYRWYVIAAKSGDKESKDRVDALSSQLAPGDRAVAETAAAEFKPQPADVRANEPQ